MYIYHMKLPFTRPSNVYFSTQPCQMYRSKMHTNCSNIFRKIKTVEQKVELVLQIQNWKLERNTEIWLAQTELAGKFI